MTPNQSNSGASGMFSGGVRIIAETAAAIAAFFGTGPLYSATIDFVENYANSQYGHTAGDFIGFVWGIACGALIFGTARMTAGAALTAAGAAIAVRIFAPY